MENKRSMNKRLIGNEEFTSKFWLYLFLLLVGSLLGSKQQGVSSAKRPMVTPHSLESTKEKSVIFSYLETCCYHSRNGRSVDSKEEPRCGPYDTFRHIQSIYPPLMIVTRKADKMRKRKS